MSDIDPNKAASRRIEGTPFFANVPSGPIRVFTICVDPENGKYTAFLASDPTKRCTAYSRDVATVQLLAEHKLVICTEMDGPA